jgi:hypothetical protein
MLDTLESSSLSNLSVIYFANFYFAKLDAKVTGRQNIAPVLTLHSFLR